MTITARVLYLKYEDYHVMSEKYEIVRYSSVATLYGLKH
jgi:hypothetical protein